MKTENWRKKYDYVGIFGKGLARVRKDDKYGFVNKQGKVVIPLKYDYVGYFSKGLVNVKKDGEWRVVNKQGIEKWEEWD